MHVFDLELSFAVSHKSHIFNPMNMHHVASCQVAQNIESNYTLSTLSPSCCLLPGCIPAGEMISALSHLPGITQAAIKQMIAKVRLSNNVNNLSLSKAEKLPVSS